MGYRINIDQSPVLRYKLPSCCDAYKARHDTVTRQNCPSATPSRTCSRRTVRSSLSFESKSPHSVNPKISMTTGHTDRERLAQIFRDHWSGRWAGRSRHENSCSNFFFLEHSHRQVQSLLIGILLSVGFLLLSVVRPILTSRAARWRTIRGPAEASLLTTFERFFRRLEIYTSITPTMTMTNKIIIVEVLAVLGVATNEMKHGRFSELMPYYITLHN